MDWRTQPISMEADRALVEKNLKCINDVNLADYFSPQELAGLCPYEQQRNKNLVLNYFMLKDLGIYF